MKIRAERGYVIPAWGNQYVKCAEHLRDSILQWHPTADITILKDFAPNEVDSVFANDAQVFAASPYRQTIKLEADMYCAGPIDHWWTMLEHRDVVVSQGARDYYDRPAISRHYRKIFDDNSLPDLYNAITYWRLSTTAQEFFALVKDIFNNWESYKSLLKFPEEVPSTDVVYAMAAVIMGPERVTLPAGLGPQIVHMKRRIIGTKTEDWTQELVWEFTNPGLRIQTVAQHGLVHYHVKDWLCR